MKSPLAIEKIAENIQNGIALQLPFDAMMLLIFKQLGQEQHPNRLHFAKFVPKMPGMRLENIETTMKQLAM